MELGFSFGFFRRSIRCLGYRSLLPFGILFIFKLNSGSLVDPAVLDDDSTLLDLDLSIRSIL